MNKMLLAAIALLCVSPLSAAEFGSDADQGVKALLSAFKDRMAPAKVDQKSVDTIFNRLAKGGLSYETTQLLEEGGQRVVKVTLVEGQGLAPEGMYQDLLCRRTFSHIEGVEQYYRKRVDGTGTIEEYRFAVSLDGQLLQAKRITMAIVGANAQGLVPNPKTIQQTDLPPSDGEVQKRWERLSAEFLKMGRTYEV